MMMGMFLPGREFLVAIIPGGVGYLELLLLFTLILILFGPERMPSLARKLGQLMEQLRKAASMFQQNLLAIDEDNAFQDLDDFPHVVESHVDEDEKVADGPTVAPKEHGREETDEP